MRNAAVVHAGRNGNLEHALGLTQITVDRFVQANEHPDFVELALRHLPDVIERLYGRDILCIIFYLYRPSRKTPRAYPSCVGSGKSLKSRFSATRPGPQSFRFA